MVVLPAPVRVSSQRPPPRVSLQSRLSGNDKGDNEMIPGAVHRSPCICLTAEENSGKSQLGDSLMKAVWSVIASNGIPYLQMMSVGSRSTLKRQKEGVALFIMSYP